MKKNKKSNFTNSAKTYREILQGCKYYKKKEVKRNA